jgi:nucleotide-binding universal stress UspA family protein
MSAGTQEKAMTSIGAQRPVVVGVDGSRSALNAVRWAAEQSHRRQLPLRLVHAFHIAPAMYPRTFTATEEIRKLIHRTVGEFLREGVAAAHEGAPQLRVDTATIEAQTVSALADEAKRAFMVVLGSRGEGGFERLLLGSTAVGLTSHARCPVAVVRGAEVDTPPPSTGAVVVGVDGSPISEAAVKFATEEAAARQVPLLAVHTWDERITDPAYLAARIEQDEVPAAQEQRALLAEQMAGYQQEHPDVPIEQVLVHDHPAQGILRQAEKAQLIVLGSRGRGGFIGMLLGSTSQAVLQHATCPVLIVRS